jgi:hypothetical protein
MEMQNVESPKPSVEVFKNWRLEIRDSAFGILHFAPSHGLYRNITSQSLSYQLHAQLTIPNRISQKGIELDDNQLLCFIILRQAQSDKTSQYVWIHQPHYLTQFIKLVDR